MTEIRLLHLEPALQQKRDLSNGRGYGEFAVKKEVFFSLFGRVWKHKARVGRSWVDVVFLHEQKHVGWLRLDGFNG